MITVRRSDTGSFVLVHEPSQVVMVGEELEATYARMEEHLRADPSLASAVPLAPPSATRGGARLVGVGVLALLPFLWLVVLHYTLGRLIDDLRDQTSAVQAEPAALQTLRAEVEALRQVVSRVEDAAGQARCSEPSEGRPGQARPPLERGARSGTAAEPGEPAEGDEGPSEGTADGGTADGEDEPEEP